MTDTKKDYLLHEAIINNKNDEVKALLAKNNDPNELDEEKHSPTYYCYLYGNMMGLNILKAYGGKLAENEQIPKLLKSAENAKNIESLQKEVEEFKKSFEEIKDLRRKLDVMEEEKNTENEKTKKKLTAINDSLEELKELKQVVEKQNKRIELLENTILNIMIKKNTSECFYEFEKMGLDLNKKIERGKTLLHLACEEGRENIVKELLEKNVEIDAEDENGLTPFHYACINGNLKNVFALVNNKADINKLNKRKKNGLFFAFSENNYEVVEYLIELTNNYDLIYHNIFELLDYDKSKEKVLMLFLKKHLSSEKPLKIVNKEGYTPIHMAVKNGHLEISKYLIENGYFDKDEKSQFGYTPLHMACENGEFDCVQMLVEKKANLDAKNNNGDLPIHKASYRGYSEIIEYLCDSGSKINPKNFNFDSPVHLLSFYGHSQALELLIKKGAKLNVKNKDGNNSLHLAVEHSHLDCVKVLLQHNINVNAKNENHYTPLITACYHGRIELTRELAKVSNLEECDEFGWTALHWASHFGHVECVKILAQSGANLNAKSTTGDTPLNNAKLHFQEETATLLVSLGAVQN